MVNYLKFNLLQSLFVYVHIIYYKY